jgi:hypothetical protein
MRVSPLIRAGYELAASSVFDAVFILTSPLAMVGDDASTNE